MYRGVHILILCTIDATHGFGRKYGLEYFNVLLNLTFRGEQT